LIQAPDLDFNSYLDVIPTTDPLGLAVRQVLDLLEIDRPPSCTLRIISTIPIASGLGSGAAISVALTRAFAEFLGRSLPNETVSDLAYEVDKIYHGTPSGIDNTVIAFEKPIFFMRGKPIQVLHAQAPFTIVIGDTGIRSSTSIAVGDLRESWKSEPKRYEPIFDATGKIASEARGWIESGQPEQIGPLMTENHSLLCEMGVSSPELDRLVDAALAAGARGAKLSGGGRGGNMIALVEHENASIVANALRVNGAVRTIITSVQAAGSS
jgi:mevalonate kinase